MTLRSSPDSLEILQDSLSFFLELIISVKLINQLINPRKSNVLQDLIGDGWGLSQTAADSSEWFLRF